MHVYVISLFAFYLSFIVSLSIPRALITQSTILCSFSLFRLQALGPDTAVRASPCVRLALLRLATRVRCVLACSSAACLHAAHRVLAALLARALTLAFALSTLLSPHAIYIMHPRRCPRPRIRSRPRMLACAPALALVLACALALALALTRTKKEDIKMR